MPTVVQKPSLSDEAAHKMMHAALDKAREIGVPQVVAVLDESGNLKAFHRMDGSPLISTEVAQNKAYTALLGRPSHETGDAMKDDPVMLAGLNKIPRISVFGGGLPILANGAVVGAIGVSGGTVEQDITCAQAGVAAIS